MDAKANTRWTWVPWILAAAFAVVMVSLPLLHYRMVYTDTKRLRIVTPGKFYRSGMMTASGLERTIREYQIKTVINLMEEMTEPALSQTYFGGGRVTEREVCERNGARYQFMLADLTSRREVNQRRPRTIDDFLAIVRDPANQPVLIHCRAGLHRTGVLTAAYRIEVDGWSPQRAWEELRENGFGEFNCYEDNDYILQYLLQPSAQNRNARPKAS